MAEAPRDANRVPTVLFESSTTPGLTISGKIDQTTGRILTDTTGGSGSPGGSNTQVQYNNAGAFGGITGATTNGTTLTLVAPVLGTPASGTLTNTTGFPVAQLAGAGTGVLTALGVNVGSAGAFVVFNGALGTPSSGTGTNITGIPVGNILPGTLVTGTYLLAENASIGLDPAGSADGKFTGITITGTAGYTQAFGDCVYLDPTDSRWEACDANSAAGADGDSRGMVGMVVVAGTDGTSCTILLQGVIRADAKFPSFTINNPIYISETAGAVTQTQPTTTDAVIRIIGAALTADEMYFNPDNAWITHT